MSRSLVLASGNRHKLHEMRSAFDLYRLGISLVAAHDIMQVPEISEKGTSLFENASIKATTVAGLGNCWTVGDDTGLFVDALDGAPGIYSARFAGPQATAAENRQKLLQQLRGVPWQDRTAYFECCLVAADPQGIVQLEAAGRCYGVILDAPRGERGFGYDSLLMIPEYRCTLAELSAVTTVVLSHRGRAVQRMAPALKRILNSSL